VLGDEPGRLRCGGVRHSRHIRHIGAQSRTECGVEATWSSTLASATWPRRPSLGASRSPFPAQRYLSSRKGHCAERCARARPVDVVA
jgi:hypothetical protein